MRRRLVLELDVGDVEPLECGTCPFIVHDYVWLSAVPPRICTCPALHGEEQPNVTEGRTLECRAAEQEANQ